MRLVTLLLFPCLFAGARDLVEDRRNAYTPGTKTHFQMREYASLREWQARRAALRDQVLASAGLLPLPARDPVRYESLGAIEREGFVVEKLRVETFPGYFVGANLFRPPASAKRGPAVLIAHGHWKHGRAEDLEEYSVPALGANLARRGYVAISWDMVGYNDAAQTHHEFGFSDSERLWSFGPLGLQLWNSIRMLDLVAALPYVDQGRIGVTGASGGGTQSFLLSAIDDRIRVSVPVNMVSAVFQGGSACENSPGLRIDASNLDLAAMMAPRPMLIVSASGDWTRHTLEEEAPQIARIYELYGAQTNFEAVRVHADHNYNADSRSRVYRFLARHLGGAEGGPEAPTGLWPADLLLNSANPHAQIDAHELFRRWQEFGKRQTSQMSDSELRHRFSVVIGAHVPSSVESWQEGNSIVLSPAGAGHRLPGLWFPGSKEMVLIVHPEGKEAAMNSREFDAAVAAGASVLLLDLFQTGSARAYRDRTSRFFLTFNRSDDAARIQDILTGVGFLARQPHDSIRIAGLEQAAVWTVLAAACSTQALEVRAAIEGFSGSDEELSRFAFIPGLQRAGGLAGARRLILKPMPPGPSTF